MVPRRAANFDSNTLCFRTEKEVDPRNATFSNYRMHVFKKLRVSDWKTTDLTKEMDQFEPVRSGSRNERVPQMRDARELLRITKKY